MPGKVKEMPYKPNILVIFGDDIGQSNLSCYTRVNGLPYAQH